MPYVILHVYSITNYQKSNTFFSLWKFLHRSARYWKACRTGRKRALEGFLQDIPQHPASCPETAPPQESDYSSRLRWGCTAI